ncbi:hypothetical protein [Bacillus sp. FJAT-49736]|uniref:hypothetical protein n=1 Tax=Bacillus sp. FJAT-49736 TaxID=2833582 RepID=UPI001BCA1DD6|nr:hypothetical protein [Bacillus sp. FJAT-49736]MBS4174664.1 hypothetical protein [Bacillus sp. FJAT-49736]
MFTTMLFFHLSGLSIWLGSLISLAVIMSLLKKQAGSKDVQSLLQKIPGLFNRWLHPSSFIVLLSGVFMIIGMNISESQKPLWLHFMEKGGSLTILLSIIVLSIISSKKIKKPLRAANVDVGVVQKGLSIYLVWLSIFIMLVLSVVFMVSYKF